MAALPKTIISLFIDGADLHTAIVRLGPFGGAARVGPRVVGVTERRPEQVAGALRRTPRGAKIVLTLPGAMCAVRPIAIGAARWAKAKDELEATIDRLLPLGPGDAMLGVVDRVPPDDEENTDASGYLIGASRREIQPLIETIESALGRPIDRVQSVHHALLGLGLQASPVADVVEPLDHAGRVRHRLRRGRIESLGEPERDDPAPTVLRLPGGQGSPSDAARVLTPLDVCLAAALAGEVAPAAFRPLAGRPADAAVRWLGPAAAAAAAAALVYVGVQVDHGRWQRAVVDLRRARAASLEPVEEINAMRARVEAAGERIERFNELTAGWGSVLPELAAAREVFPPGALVYSLSLQGDQLVIRGEAAKASDVLQRLEASPAFEDAARDGSVVPLTERPAERFTLTARREAVPRPEAEEGGP